MTKAPIGERTLKCKECGQDFQYSGKGIRYYCDDHTKTDDRARALNRKKSQATIHRDKATNEHSIIREAGAYEAQKLACVMSLYPKKEDLWKCARMVGIKTSSTEELLELAEEAKQHFPELIKGSSAGWSAISSAYQNLALTYAMENISLVSARDYASILRNLAIVDEMKTGKSQKTYGKIVINFGDTEIDKQNEELNVVEDNQE